MKKGLNKKEKVAENTSGSLRALAMTANEIRIEQAERRLYAILDRHTRLIEGLTKMMKADDLEEDMQKNLKETNSMLDDCFWQFLSPLEAGDKVVSAYDTHMV
jgi:predicted Mrr-cat superfamily restriction endonuclease